MKHKKLQILVPQYKETEEVISFLLNSIEKQEYINKDDIGVIICSDGGEYILDNIFLNKYTYDINYVICEHKGVSATRNKAFDLSDADYIMYCDADDGFCNVFGIKVILSNIKLNEDSGTPFDILSSKFYRENVDNGWSLVEMNHNSTFVHGRVFRRQFLVDNNIRFKEDILANEDSYFNVIANMYSKSTKLLNMPIYCWKNNKDSVTADPKFIMKTLHHLLKSNDGILEEMVKLNKSKKDIATTTFNVICKLYLDMNKPCWYLPENKEYKDIAIKSLQWYLNKWGTRCSDLTDNEKKNILQKEREGEHYTNIETITFNDFIKAVMSWKEGM